MTTALKRPLSSRRQPILSRKPAATVERLPAHVQLVLEQGRVGLNAEDLAQAIGHLRVGTIGVGVVILPPGDLEDVVKEGI